MRWVTLADPALAGLARRRGGRHGAPLARTQDTVRLIDEGDDFGLHLPGGMACFPDSRRHAPLSDERHRRFTAIDLLRLDDLRVMNHPALGERTVSAVDCATALLALRPLLVDYCITPTSSRSRATAIDLRTRKKPGLLAQKGPPKQSH